MTDQVTLVTFSALALKMLRGSSSPALSRLGCRSKVQLVDKMGIDLLNDPLYNKGTAFPIDERDRLGLRGLLPPYAGRANSISAQMKRIMNRFDMIKIPLLRYQYLKSLQDRNEVLFYRVLMENLRAMAPIIYTPTVGEACQQFGNIFRRCRGMYFSNEDLGSMHAMVYNWPVDDVKLIVVTDGSRILGLGDLGVNGMGIPIGKLSLYVAGAGIEPSQGLPVVVDVGTDNQALLDDDLYLGLRNPRIPGGSPKYFEVMDEFVSAITTRWPKALIQFEDFNNNSALAVLRRYRDKVLCFNDDIQGTGSVTVAAILAAVRGGFEGMDSLDKLRVVIAGAGSAGTGIARQLDYAIFRTTGVRGKPNIYMVDDKGLLGKGRGEKDARYTHSRFIREDDTYPDETSLINLVKAVKPNVIIGVTGCAGIFTEDVIREIGKHSSRPLIFPMSNPTVLAECTAEQAYTWTEGRAIFASGSPFQPVTLANGKKCYPNQANNMFTFPGLGLGAILGECKSIGSSMLFEASMSLASHVTKEQIENGKLFPEIEDIRIVSKKIATRVIETAQEEGKSTIELPKNLEEYIESQMWKPKYSPLIRPYHHE